MSKETFGSYVKNKRIEKGMTLREFCRRSDFSPANWSRVERGVHQPTRKECYFQIVAETLGLNSVEFNILHSFFPKPYAKEIDSLRASNKALSKTLKNLYELQPSQLAHQSKALIEEVLDAHGTKPGEGK